MTRKGSREEVDHVRVGSEPAIELPLGRGICAEVDGPGRSDADDVGAQALEERPAALLFDHVPATTQQNKNETKPHHWLCLRFVRGWIGNWVGAFIIRFDQTNKTNSNLIINKCD